MFKIKITTLIETEEAALRRRLIERLGLSAGEAQDVVDAYINAESDMVGVKVPDATHVHALDIEVETL